MTEPDQGRGFEATRSEIGIDRSDGLIELGHGLVKLRADAADEEVLKRRHPLQEESRPVLVAAIPLGNGSE